MLRPLHLACIAAVALTACKKSPSDRAAPVASAPGLQALPTVKVESARREPVDPLPLVHAHPAGAIDHLARARALHEEGDAVGALAEARKQLADDGEDADALGLLAQLARASKNRDLASAAYLRLARIDPEDAVPLVQAARLELEGGSAARAVELAAEAMRRDDENVEVYQVLGRAHLEEGDLASAIRVLEQARVLAPSHGYVLNNLGFAHLRANQNGEALDVLTRAAELLPQVAYVQNNLGVALERAGRIDEARDAYARSTALSPRYVKARINGERTARSESGDDSVDDSVHTPEPSEE